MKKILTLIFALSLLLVNVYAEEIYTYKEIIPISDGITLTKVESFYSDHNVSYSYIEADLSNDKVNLTLLKSQKGQDYSETNATLSASEKDVVASLNGDFFSNVGDKTISLGIEIKDGEILQSPINPGTMATISKEDEEIFMGYLDFHIMVVAPNWEYAEVRHLNKHTSYYGDILMFTKGFNGGYSPAPGGEVVEVVVEDGIVTEFRRNMPPCKIPENGCVLAVSEGNNMFFSNNFEVGDEIKFDYYITPDISSADVAFGGGALLVSEGKPLTSFSHNIAGYNPRSAIGITKDGKKLYLVAVNGRQGESRGMSMTELASLMKNLGCHTAVNLDGGGSTSMLASTIWNEKMHIVNSPSETRRVINAIGITYEDSSKDLSPYEIALEAESNSVFIGESVKISAAVYDKNLRAVSGDITWSASSGTIKDGVFTADKGGKVKITAKCKKATAYLELFVVDRISGINVNDRLKLSVGESKTLSLEVFDSYGHHLSVKNLDAFTFTSDNPKVISVSKGKVTAHKNGTAIITVKKDNAESYISVISGENTEENTYGFEKEEGSVITYPSYVGGDYYISDEYYLKGDTSGALSFDFSEDTEESKAVYYVLPEPLTFTGNFSISVYSIEDYPHELRALLEDADGKEIRIILGKNLEGGSWHTLTGKLPGNNTSPYTLKRIYALYTKEEPMDFGTLFFDDLNYSYSVPYSYPYKSANKYSDSYNGVTEGKVLRIGAVYNKTHDLMTKFADAEMKKVLSESDFSILLGEGKGFFAKENKSFLHVNLDTKKGGIRASSSSQWTSLKKAIDGSSSDYVIITSDNPIFGKDQFENKVIKDYLASTKKDVMVVTKGTSDSFTIINGVRYFTLSPIDNNFNLVSKVNRLSYIEISFEDNLIYSVKQLI